MNMRLLLLGLVPFLCAGCLGPQPSTPTYWPFSAQKTVHTAPVHTRNVVLGLNRIRVSEPYDSRRFCVLRADGSLAFDDLNAFVARPSRALMPLFEETLLRFNFAWQTTTDFNPSSAIPQLTLDVKRFAMDCREKGKRQAICDLACTYKGADGKVIRSAGAAVASAEDCDYGTAFSQAFADALVDALEKITARIKIPRLRSEK